jgi:chloramphenicol 3-O phosphotransferase
VTPQQGYIVLLNGTPSAGKSSVAAALREQLVEPHYWQSLDQFRQGYLPRYWSSSPFPQDLFIKCVTTYMRLLRDLVDTGHRVIAEAVATPDLLPTYLATFQGVPVFFVGLRCPIDEVRRREQARDDRVHSRMDYDERTFDDVHRHGVYDLEIDTSRVPASQAAAVVANALVGQRRWSAFDRLRSSTADLHGR